MQEIIKRAGPVDAHHQQSRFTRGLGSNAGDPVVVGRDVAVANEAGQPVSVLGFLNKIPA